jgi:alanyl-tRNA synthetase
MLVPVKYLKSKESTANFMRMLASSPELPEGCYITSEDGIPFVEGRFLFKLKDTHGFPLEMAIDITLGRGLLIRWISFIECARDNLWWDFQTIQVVEHALQDAGCDRTYVSNVIDRFKIYSYTIPHPELICH